MSEVKIIFRDQDNGDVYIDSKFDRDVTGEEVELTGAERVAAGILYRLNNNPETWLLGEEDEK